MKLRWPITIAVLSFLATLVWHAPAALLYAWTTGETEPDVTLHGLHGTLAAGGFSALTVGQRRVLSDASWETRPLWLALMRMTVDVQTSGDALLRARVSRTPFGKLKLSGLNAAVDVNTVLAAGGQVALPLDGQVRLTLTDVQFDGGIPVHAEGTAELQGLAWTLARQPLQLGDFTATLTTDASGILASIASGPGPLELDGEAQLGKDNRYDLHLRLKPRPDAGPQVTALIRSMDPPDGQGWYHIRRQGELEGT